MTGGAGVGGDDPKEHHQGPSGPQGRGEVEEGGGGPDPADAEGVLNEVYWQVLGGEQELLWEVKPSFVVLVDPQVSIVRQLEVYRAYHPGQPLRVYFLYYSSSSEKQKYMAALQRELSVFDDLIKMKGYIMVPSIRPGQPQALVAQGGSGMAGPSPYHPGADPNGDLSNALTRKGLRGSEKAEAAPTVVVDMREFVSSLPAVLHQRGIKLEPVTLEVGDYVLTPDICLERKAIPDLIQSLQSGRLYQQAESMCRHYKTAVLLIEFEQDRAFALQGADDLDYTISQNSLQSRIALLVLHFPKLRIIWSRSLHATADIFISLKNQQDQPEATTAAAIGVPEVGPDGRSMAAEALINQPAIDLLRRLPGINERNYHSVMSGCESLADLAGKSRQELAVLLGGEKAARMLHEFLNAPCAVL